MKRSTVSLPDDVHAQARRAGLNLSATLRTALLERLSPEGGRAAVVVEQLLGSLDAVSTVDLVRGEIARVLARKIDATRWSDTAATATATAVLARQLCAVLDAIDGGATRHDALTDLREQRRQRREALGVAQLNGGGQTFEGVGGA